MASSRQHLCDICFIQHITEDAQVWCPECEENFCEKYLETTLSDLLTNISNFVEDRKANLKELKEQKMKCEGDLQSSREAINKYFDALEADLNNKMQQAFVKQESEIETVLGNIESHMTKVKEKENLNCIKSIASDFQSFMVMRMMSQRTHTEETEQQNWIKSEKCHWVKISVIPYDIKSSEDSPPSIGQIKVQANCNKVTLKIRKSREAQLIGPISTSRNIETIQLRLKLECKIPCEYKFAEPQIMDGGILPSGELIFCDRKNGRLIILNSKGDVDKNITLLFCPIRFAIIDENSIAVTSADRVNIVNFKTGKVLRTFAEGLKARSISLHKRNFIIENLGKGYVFTDLLGNTQKSMPIKFSKDFYHHPVIIKDKLYYAEQDGSEVVCLDFEGNQFLKIKDERLFSPYGMTLDSSNLLFVCGIKSNNVVVISADGSTFKEIVAPNEHLNGAISAYFNKIKQELLIVTQNGNVSVYDVI
ncbi:unnamed protein product [Mytilus coruscus]|uniref:B box-type domain-containing protein n=1 Tax=Mytilus coruscus TaxID=42192 RepID=A0A6J8C879_MYTCO|nr:unnamed protein product [Mytilus coruscus]